MLQNLKITSKMPSQKCFCYITTVVPKLFEQGAEYRYFWTSSGQSWRLKKNKGLHLDSISDFTIFLPKFRHDFIQL